MRIVGGRRRGLRLAAPSGGDVRPTTDRVREALFNILAHGVEAGPDGPCPAGLRVLDAFAGTGALGLEAWSRGAAEVTFIENAREAADLLRRNVAAAGAESDCDLLLRDAAKPGPAPRTFDLVLMDPPYRAGLAAPALEALRDGGWIAAGALTVVETDGRDGFEPPDGFAATDERRYGRTRLTVLSLT
jgi:16S rRNA (guanine966-N2)-methyltransferase